MAPPRIPVKDRLLANHAVDVNGCWIWLRGKTRDGYGVLGDGRGKQLRAHRASYEVFVGPVADGLLVCHRCDTPLCINPAHLFTGSPQENMSDMVAKGRKPKTIPKKQKVSDAERETIKTLRRQGATLKELASQYGVSFQTISAICLGSRSYR